MKNFIKFQSTFHSLKSRKHRKKKRKFKGLVYKDFFRFFVVIFKLIYIFASPKAWRGSSGG